MNKLKRKNIVSKVTNNNTFFKNTFTLLLSILISTNVLAQVTFTTTPASL